MNYVTVFKHLMKGKTHLAPCICAACVYPGYKKRSKHLVGRHYDEMTFFIYWLMIEIKKNYLSGKENAKNPSKKRAIFFYKGKFLMATNPKGFDKAPYLRETKAVLSEIANK